MNLQSAFLALILCLSSSNSYAEVTDATTICVSCSHAVASSLAMNRVGPDEKAYIYVADYESENLWRFLVESNSDGGKVVKVSTPAEIEDEVKVIFHNWLKIKELPNEVSIRIPDSASIQSAFELPGNGQKKNYIAKYLLDNIEPFFNFPNEVISDEYTQIAHAAIGYFNVKNDNRVKIIFGDGSTAQYKLDFPLYMDKTDVRFVLIKESLSDSLGNFIPYNIESLRFKEGELSISQDEEINFVLWKSLATSLGFELEGNWSQIDEMSCPFRCSCRKCELDCSQNR